MTDEQLIDANPLMNPGTDMVTPTQWLERCAAVYRQAGLSDNEAKDAALTCWEEFNRDPSCFRDEGPEDMAVGDIDCWEG